MEFKVNTPDISTNGCSRQGYLYTSYDNLIKTLGLDAGWGDKTQAEWYIEGEMNGKKVVATIYDWKTYGDIKNVTEWHIGGLDRDALKVIKLLFQGAKVSAG